MQVRRRGAISAEPINEEDAASYVKKVSFIKTTFLAFFRDQIAAWRDRFPSMFLQHFLM